MTKINLDSERKYQFGLKPIFIFPANNIGGHELMALEIIKNILQSIEYTEVYISPCLDNRLEGELEKLKSEKIKILFLPSVTPKLELLQVRFNFSHRNKIKSFISMIYRKEYSEVILVQGDIEIGCSYLEECIKQNVKYVSYIPYAHDAKTVGKKLHIIREYYAKYLFSITKRYITISKIFENQIYSKSENSEVFIIRNNVRDLRDIITKRKDFLVSSEYLNREKKHICVIGRVSYKHKGQDLLLDALAQLDRETVSRICLTVIGEGADSPDLVNRANQIQGLDLVMAGWLNEPWDIAYKTDLLVIPSRFEGVPLVMLEAQELGINIIASKRDGMLEYLSDNQLFYNSDDLKKLILL